MNYRFPIVTVALLSSTLIFAQGRPISSKQDKNGVTKTQLSSAQNTYHSSPVNTKQFFPQISNSVGMKVIRPDNPSTDFMVKSKRSKFNGSFSMTNTPGPVVNSYFPGINFTGWVPPDPDVAVGPNNIVQVVNTRITFFSKTGTQQFSQTSSTFFSGIAQVSSQFDPKVIYDEIAGRFIIIFPEVTGSGGGISNVLFAISDDSNPNGTWHRYRFIAKTTIGPFDYWLDYPGLGYNKDGYVINGNLFPFAGGSFGGVEFITVPKTAVLTGAAVITSQFFDANSGSAQMAETNDPTNGFVYGAARRFTNNTRFYAFANVNTAAPSMSLVDIPVTNSPSPNGSATSTGGVSVDTVGARIFTAVLRNGRLYLSYNHDNGARVGVRWTELNMGTWPTAGTITELQAGNYVSGSLDYFMPAVSVNKHGDVSILFSGMSSTVTSDLVVAGRVSTDPLNTMSAPSILASATGSPYIYSRWGDYFGVDVDPVDGETFWGTGMVVRSDGRWTTHVLSWTVSKTHFLVPTTRAWVRGVEISGNTASLAADDGNYNVGRAGITLFAGEPPAQLEVETVAPAGQVLDLELNVIAKVNTPGLSQRIQLWDYANAVWVALGTQSSTTTDSLHTEVAAGTLSNFIEGGTRKVKARVQWYQTGISLLFPWTVSVDQVEWEIRVR